MTFRLSLHTPEACAYDGEAESIVVPGADGLYGVLANHAPMIGVVRDGLLSVRGPDGHRWFVVGEGIAEIGGNAVSLAVETARPVSTEAEAETVLADYLKDKALPALVAKESLPNGR
jgi:F-type H+-transporting ATPase subunit epsilon